MKRTVNIPTEKLKEIRTSLQSAIDFIDEFHRATKPPRISKAERRKLEVARLLSKK